MQVVETHHENKMGTTPIGKLLFAMSIPAAFSMLIQALYNVIDTVYTSRIIVAEENAAINALSLAFPIQTLLLAVALGVGVGTNSVVARLLGAKRKEEASNQAKTGFIMALFSSLLFFALSLFFPQLFASLLDTNQTVKGMVEDYLSVIMMFSVFMMVELFASKLLQATGNMLVPMIAQLIGAITNIILDPIFIFGKGMQLGTTDSFWSFSWGLGLGVKGAAIATVIAQGVAMTFSLIILFLGNHEIDFSFQKFKLKLKNIGEILRVGAPVMFMNSINALTVLLLNIFIGKVYEGAETILGVYFKLQSFVFMPVFGLTQGAMPIMGYNYGANKKERFQSTFRLSLFTSVIILTLGTVIFQVYPDFLLTIITVKGDLRPLAIQALRIISFAFIPAAINIIFSSMFQAIGHGLKSLIMSMLRQVIIIIPLAYILSNIFETLPSIWICFPIADAVALVIFFPIALKTVHHAFNKKANEIQIQAFNDKGNDFEVQTY